FIGDFSTPTSRQRTFCAVQLAGEEGFELAVRKRCWFRHGAGYLECVHHGCTAVLFCFFGFSKI
ncbi:MAG: hypothetical protein WAJ91_09510, partial [Rhodoplanes sp.]